MVINDAQAQRRSKNYLKKKSRKIGKYKGGSIHFDKNKRYISLGFPTPKLRSACPENNHFLSYLRLYRTPGN